MLWLILELAGAFTLGVITATAVIGYLILRAMDAILDSAFG